MPTKKQMRANRSNAQHSSGPKTEEGKAVSRYNSVRHGLLVKDILVISEDADEFAQFRLGLIDCREPVGQLEQELADRLAILAWRLRRFAKIEAALFGSLGGGDKESYSTILANAFAKGAVTFQNLARYERHVSGEYFRTLHQLERLQAARAGQLVAPPAADDLDINVTVAHQACTATRDLMSGRDDAADLKKLTDRKDARAEQRIRLDRERLALRKRELENQSGGNK